MYGGVRGKAARRSNSLLELFGLFCSAGLKRQDPHNHEDHLPEDHIDEIKKAVKDAIRLMLKELRG